ncbi:glycosyl hydrolase family 28 protein [Novosphingobium resinovorum]|uniref:glycosyl hydrolase family 28 protein n=1 Tax=Novosphingobium resinovorum TaxID=158500 RepID=UPI002ED64552|nr:glycosyl hydrolase family 28 protein [Novosphingobium resinovorum]
MKPLAVVALGALAVGLPAQATPAAAPGVLEVYPPPPGSDYYTSFDDTFTVRVRQPGGEWRNLYEYRVMVDLDKPQPASMVTFGTSGPVEVAIQKNNGAVRHVAVRPASRGIEARLVGAIAYLKLDGPANLSVEFDDDRLHNLHLFANPIYPAAGPAKGRTLVAFGAGIHVPPPGQDSFRFESNTDVRLAGGAILKGQVDVANAHDVRIVGPGIVKGGKEGITVLHSQAIEIEGPIVINPGHYTLMCGQSRGLTIRNLRTFSAGGWTDGIDLMACSDVHIDGAFLRTSDDAVAIYADRWDYHGDARNYLVENSTLWADVAHPVNIGLHGSKDEPRTIENLVFRNIDILDHDEDDRDYQGALAITDGDNNLVRNVVFDDIRIDRIEEGMLFNFRVVFNQKYSLAPGRGIENIVMRNVRSSSGNANRPVIAGFDAHRTVRDVSLVDVGGPDRALSLEDIDVGAYAERVSILPP